MRRDDHSARLRGRGRSGTRGCPGRRCRRGARAPGRKAAGRPRAEVPRRAARMQVRSEGGRRGGRRLRWRRRRRAAEERLAPLAPNLGLARDLDVRDVAQVTAGAALVRGEDVVAVPFADTLERLQALRQGHATRGPVSAVSELLRLRGDQCAGGDAASGEPHAERSGHGGETTPRNPDRSDRVKP